jgi:DNA invertase Pin-like site-specific DNA recombinase
MNANTNGQKLTILYARLSKGDELLGESNSISNQRKLLEEYAERNGFTPHICITDDDFTGTNFARPGWNELIERVDNGEVGTIILKSLDRMARNYLQSGLYREMFAEKGIRLIAMNDGIDTFEREDDFIPFRELMAEHYARDTSKKIKSVIHKKGRDGIPLGTIPLYGYRKDPDNKDVRIIDDEAAAVVRRIFKMTVDGIGPYQIARILMEEKVERPSYYLYRAGIVQSPGKCNLDLPYNWRGTTVSTILEKREYMGDLVNFKTYKPSFKSKKQIAVEPDKQMVFEGALPAIVERETWELAQTLRKTVRRISKGGYEPNPLTGLLYCADCGEKLHNRRSYYDTDKRGNKIYPVDTYECRTYRKNAEKFVDECSIHFIRTSVVRELLLETIKTVSTYAREHEQEFVAKLRADTAIQQSDTAKSHKRTLAKNDKRIAELDRLFIKIYEDNAIGKLNDERFALMSGNYEREQAELKAQNEAIAAELAAFEQDNLKADRFLELVRKYTDFSELTPAMIHEFIEKVVVHEADKSSGERRQQVDVYLNFIGQFTVPGTEPRPLTPEEQAAEEKRLAEKIRKNENLRAWRAKKRAEKKAAQAAAKSV